MRIGGRTPSRPHKLATTLAGLGLAVALPGCVSLHQARLGAGAEPTLIGPAVRDKTSQTARD